MPDSRESDGKHCSRCSQLLPRSEFRGNAAARDGLQSWCRGCQNAYKRETRPRRLDARPVEPDGMKWCRRCRRVKPLDEFDPHRGTRDGKQTNCRRCSAEIYRERRASQGLLSRPPEVPAGAKFCRSCERVLPLSAWSRRANSTDGYHFRCKECTAAADRADYLARQYGLTPDEVDAMVEAQGGVCAICQQLGAVHVDHDHRTGSIRGVLCFRCNAALGQLRDDVDVLRRSALYLTAAGTATEPQGSPSSFDMAFATVLLRSDYAHAS